MCGFLCGYCSLKHKECRHQHSGTAALCSADGQPHPPPRDPAPDYEDTKLQPSIPALIVLYEQVQPITAKTVDNVSDHKCHLDDIAATAKPLNMSENKAYSTSDSLIMICPAPIYEDILQEDGGEEMEVTEQIQLKRDDAYNPI